ncbi:MAG TPA: hypothetical protein VN660_07530 [Steroidobacteraceae bacterium]|nr:hypothetical protein [Steroidobacteraceae bacterium]
MKIAKPMLLISTPLGMIWGLIEGWRMAGGLVLLMAFMMGVVGAGFAIVVRAVREERASGGCASQDGRLASSASESRQGLSCK